MELVLHRRTSGCFGFPPPPSPPEITVSRPQQLLDLIVEPARTANRSSHKFTPRPRRPLTHSNDTAITLHKIVAFCMWIDRVPLEVNLWKASLNLIIYIPREVIHF